MVPPSLPAYKDLIYRSTADTGDEKRTATFEYKMHRGDVKPDELSRIVKPQPVIAVLGKPCAWMRFEHSRTPRHPAEGVPISHESPRH